MQTDDIANGMNEIVNTWEQANRTRLDAMCAQAFVVMKMLGMLPDFPESVPELTDTQIGALRFAVNTIDMNARLG